MMKITRINTIVLLSVFATAFVTRANVNIQWNTDSYSAFDVTISGTGSWQGTITSPSGLWQLNALNTFAYSTGDPGNPVNIANYGIMTFLGQIPSSIDPNPLPFDNQLKTQGYSDFLPLSAVVQDNNNWGDGFTFLSGLGWGGQVPITVTSMPDVADASTWDWISEYSASGPSLALEPAPEPGAASVGLVGLLLLAGRMIRRRI